MASNSASKSSRRRKFLILFILAVLLIALELSASFPFISSPVERMELTARDTAFLLRGEIAPNEDIVIVAVDDQSLVWVNERWPWSRSYFAEIIDWLNEAGAKVIAFDVTLFDPSPNLEDDVALAQAIAEANSFVTVSQIFSTQYSVTLDVPEDIFLPGIDGYGITEIERDDDARVRGINAYKEYKGEVLYNWAFEIAREFLDIAPPTNASQASVDFNGYSIPLNQQGKLLINFAGGVQSYPTYPAAFVPLGDYSPELFKDKIVIFGASSETLQDIYPTPFSATYPTPGAEVVANAVATLISGEFFSIAPPWVNLLIIVGMAVFSRIILIIRRPTWSIMVMIGGMAAYLAAYLFLFNNDRLQISFISPMLMLFLGVVIPSLEQAVTQEVEKRRVRSMFSRFISPEMVNQLLDTQDISSINKRTELTILFSDIRGFTTLSEKLSPEDVVALLNPYLEIMSAIIHKHGGTVDKYEGDAIVAFFGEPIPHQDHAIRAARAALEMREALSRLNRKWATEGTYSDTFEMGIGINTGEVFVGLLGSEERVNYTIIGDAANLAARLQDQTKEFGFPILISGDTYESIKKKFYAEFVAKRVLKGKSEAVDIFRLMVERDK
ncbi:MAG: adenylate/guanylate cyclase domain-containing protein [Chloroflexota bacterium]